MVCCDSKSDGDLDAVTEVECVWFVVTARVTVILMHSDLDAVTEVGCVWFVVTARVTVILMHSDLDAVTEVGCVVCCDSKSDGDLDAL